MQMQLQLQLQLPLPLPLPLQPISNRWRHFEFSRFSLCCPQNAKSTYKNNSNNVGLVFGQRAAL